jgi:hypothetical protein
VARILLIQLPLTEMADAELEALLEQELARTNTCVRHPFTTLSNDGTCPIDVLEEIAFSTPTPINKPVWLSRMHAKDVTWTE